MSLYKSLIISRQHAKCHTSLASLVIERIVGPYKLYDITYRMWHSTNNWWTFNMVYLKIVYDQDFRYWKSEFRNVYWVKLRILKICGCHGKFAGALPNRILRDSWIHRTLISIKMNDYRIRKSGRTGVFRYYSRTCENVHRFMLML